MKKSPTPLPASAVDPTFKSNLALASMAFIFGWYVCR
jgi:hypothetical protein